MRVIDINGKEREVKSLTRIMHDTPTLDGGIVKEPYVEVVIEGKQSTWTEWWGLKEFEELNPEIIVG
jgi:hypothetical protein